MRSLLLLLLLAGCAIPDHPEIGDATVSLTLATPTGMARVLLACPPVPGLIPPPRSQGRTPRP